MISLNLSASSVLSLHTAEITGEKMHQLRRTLFFFCKCADMKVVDQDAQPGMTAPGGVKARKLERPQETFAS
jgi:hypothetical protein